MLTRVVSWKRQMSWATLWRPGVMLRPQYWVKVGRMCQIPVSGKFATFHMKPVSGETFMPLECVILEGGGNAELGAWKAFDQWVNTIRKAAPKPAIPEHVLYAARIVIVIQGGDTISKKVMEDLSSEERRSVVDESSSIVLSLLKREGVGAHCQMLSERVRRLSERALQKWLECSRRAKHKWLCQALKGGQVQPTGGGRKRTHSPSSHWPPETVKETSRQTRNVQRNCTLTSGNVSGEAKTPSVSSKK